jgi:hypothetical protein
MTVCPNTGLTIPECSCQACLEQQLASFTAQPAKRLRGLRRRLIGARPRRAA